MEHLWTNREAGGGSLTVREVHETVGTQRELAYTTVMTVLDRLAKKRLVTQERDGRAYRYSPVSTREELTAQTMRETLGDLEARDPKGAMLSHGNLLSNARVLHRTWRWQSGDILIHALPIFHIHGLLVACHGALIERFPDAATRVEGYFRPARRSSPAAEPASETPAA